MPLRCLLLLLVLLFSLPLSAKPKMYISFQWHYHQPIYWPYEPVTTTASTGKYGFNLIQTFTDRSGPYTTFAADAVEAGKNAGLPHIGAQVSLSGSLAENLNALASAGIAFQGWKTRWAQAASWKTSLGNPRMDLVRFGYHHPLMALVSPQSIVRQMYIHSWAVSHWIDPALGQSKGIFPPENGFSEEMIPALAEAGVEWVFVDNIHFDRARSDYPYTKSSNLPPPNPAEQGDFPAANWVQLNGVWAPSKVSAPWGYQPHRIAYTDPYDGTITMLIAVPTARYEGNEDGKGGFGALLYDKVFSQYEAFNTDEKHPMLIVLHHDGDNYGGGMESYYHGNWAAFIDWLKANPDRFEATTVQDYLAQFPPDPGDVIHVEPGSWSGADNGDPEFKKWNGDPNATGYSPDHNSWAVVTAATNRIETAQAKNPQPDIGDIVAGTGGDMAKAWHFFLNSQTSCYWYWDFSESGKWDSHPTRAVNMAMPFIDKALGAVADGYPPSIYPPQREPYNPGGLEWSDKPMPSDFTVWTYVYDVSGLDQVVLKWRIDPDAAVGSDNSLYSTPGWQTTPMSGKSEPSQTDPQPVYKADRFEAVVTGVSDALVDYFVEAKDKVGNMGRTPIRHVWVGKKSGVGPTGPWTPSKPCMDDQITIPAAKAGSLHWGVNGWKKPIDAYWPAGTKPWTDGIAVETPLTPVPGGFSIQVGPFNNPGQPVTEVNFVFHWQDGGWDKDQTIPIAKSCTPQPDPIPETIPEPVPETVPEPVPDPGPDPEPDPEPDPGPVSDSPTPDLPYPDPLPDQAVEGMSEDQAPVPGDLAPVADTHATADATKTGGSSGCAAGPTGCWSVVLLLGAFLSGRRLLRRF